MFHPFSHTSPWGCGLGRVTAHMGFKKFVRYLIRNGCFSMENHAFSKYAKKEKKIAGKTTAIVKIFL